MDLVTITNGILDFYKNNLNFFLQQEDEKITTPANYYEGDVDILKGGEVNFVLAIDRLNINELENTNNLLEIEGNIFIISKAKLTNINHNKMIKKYANAIYNLHNINNSLGNVVDYTKVSEIEFYEVMDNPQQNLKILLVTVKYYKEI